MDTEKIKVLYIDDEINNLFAFKANLRYDYDILTTNNIDEVFSILNSNSEIRIIFCDKRMPNKNGIDLLKEIRSIYPNIIRIIITAYTDKNDIIDSINKCHIFKYLEKPFNFEEIIDTINTSNDYYLSKNKKNDSAEKNNYRNEIANKLLVINSIIRYGYKPTMKKLGDKYKDYIISIENANYYDLKHELISELKILVN